MLPHERSLCSTRSYIEANSSLVDSSIRAWLTATKVCIDVVPSDMQLMSPPAVRRPDPPTRPAAPHTRHDDAATPPERREPETLRACKLPTSARSHFSTKTKGRRNLLRANATGVDRRPGRCILNVRFPTIASHYTPTWETNKSTAWASHRPATNIAHCVAAPWSRQT
ncbi:hypothetical protein CPLU01_05101 [Colletotrichum plurivorum]|uniref:Uncharacterized protein n=1 Tax=Colletotrichum plurivorum TaxID=2175906 RepID=A0A8H6NIH8_9PEZI|nr:hypothetical protein CPLU01_05101 [Colletotrichum plurivorum]